MYTLIIIPVLDTLIKKGECSMKKLSLLFALVLTICATVYADGWGFRKIPGSEPEIPSSIVEMLKKYNGYYIGDNTKKELYLTFDNGYENGYTPKVLDILKEKNVPAAFFITGDYLLKETELVKRMLAEGHIIGNHGLKHKKMNECTKEQLDKDILGFATEYEKLTGGKLTYLRPPCGEYNEHSLKYAMDNGYKTMFWSVAYVDWKTDDQKGKDHAFKKVTEQLHNGAIILLHTVSKDNAEALGDIIDHARAQGYEFHSMDNLK